MSTHNPEQLYIGIDGGGSKCRAQLMTNSGKVLGVGIGGPANPFHDQAQSKISILQAVNMALSDAGLAVSESNNIIVGIGLAGVNLPSVFKAMSCWLHPFKRLHLTTDLHIACLAAHNCDQGAVMITGTGSCGYAFVNNKATMIGGHGFMFGDKGSGAWMGLEAIKAILLASDNLGPKSILSDWIGNHLQAQGIMIVDRMGAAKPSDYAQLAAFVFDAADTGDEVAKKIVDDGADYMSAVAEQLWQTEPGRMALIGGLSERLISHLKPSVVAGLSVPLNKPEVGAIYYAKQQEKLKL